MSTNTYPHGKFSPFIQKPPITMHEVLLYEIGAMRYSFLYLPLPEWALRLTSKWIGRRVKRKYAAYVKTIEVASKFASK